MKNKMESIVGMSDNDDDCFHSGVAHNRSGESLICIGEKEGKERREVKEKNDRHHYGVGNRI